MTVFTRWQRQWRGFFTWLLLSVSQALWAADTVQVVISGVKDELLSNVLAYLSLEQQKKHPRLSGQRIRRLHKQAPDEIKRALQPFGYYHVNITATLDRLHKTEWKAHYLIELGDPLIVKTVTVNLNGEGEHDPAFSKLLTHFPIKIGDTLNHTHYEKGKRLLRNLAEENGYFDARLTQHEIRIDEPANQAEVILFFNTGQRYRFGKVTFKQERFNESLLQRFLTFQPGDLYSGNQLLTFKNGLIDSDYFDNVEVNVKRTAATADKQLPIEVTLTPRKPTKFSFGIGYGTDVGVRGSVGWEKRYINQYGHRFSAKTELSQIRKSATARYYIPTGHLKEDYFAITAGYKDEQVRKIDSQLLLLGVSKNQGRSLFGTKLREVVGIEYRDDKYTLGSDSGHSKLLMPNISWSYVKADDRIYTLHGQKVQLEVRGALNGIGSNTSLLQTRLNAIIIRKLYDKGRFIARGDAGYSLISLLEGDFHDLPPSIRFFAGGDRSVRGYDYQAVGPTNQEGDVIGGKNLLVGSLEYEHRLLEKWSVATFYDTGNAFNDFSESLKQGAGIGVRWHSPVGPIRIDLATALSEPGHPLRLHVTVGPDL